MPFKSFNDLPEEEVFPGATRKIIYEDKIMLVLWKLEPGTTLPLHSHPHEQITHILEGRALVTVGAEKREVGPGDVYSAPYGSNLEHSVEVLGDEPFLELDIFHPIREDFLK